MKTLFKVPYGSKLYGTATPTSDSDFKVVYLPSLTDLLLNKKLHTFKKRFDADGNPVDDNAPMPDNGEETEYVPFHTFVRDFVAGQTYAVEVAWYLNGLNLPGVQGDLVRELMRFKTVEVQSMLGFALKQTFDYVHRGERLVKAQALAGALDHLQHNRGNLHEVPLDKELRLDHVVSGQKVLHFVAKSAGLELGTTVNNGKTMETLKLNGRDYLETTTVGHLRTAVQKLVDSYGHRTQAAAEMDVDWKSMSHAVRVYKQALELLQTGQLTFPRPAEEVKLLLAVKRGEMVMDDVHEMLLDLEQQTAAAVLTSPFQKLTPKLKQDVENWLVAWLVTFYELDPLELVS
jgi:hypothetical protein